jgi:hypothetical protein
MSDDGELGELPRGLVAKVYQLGKQAGMRARADDAYRKGMVAGGDPVLR